jgi:hypothetical protein
VKLNKFTAKRNFDKSLLPKPREKLQQYILRVDSDLQVLITTHGVIIDEEDLVNRILYMGYPVILIYKTYLYHGDLARRRHQLNTQN